MRQPRQNSMMSEATTRRQFLGLGLAAAGGAALAGTTLGDEKPASAAAPKRLAAINSIYRLKSHAYHIVGRLMHGYSIQGFHHQPPFKVARMYNDQYPDIDLSRELAPRMGFELVKTPTDAVRGPNGLDVDGVLLIIEHGDYPLNHREQVLYPRYEYFMEVMRVFRASGRAVPVFVDKHFSYAHEKAAEMLKVAKELAVPLMAGSSLPVTWRQPDVEPPIGTPFTEALICHAGGVEIYGFHALEILQVMMERRGRRETGIRAVAGLQGKAVWQAGDAGLWSWDLLESALRRSPSRNIRDPRANVPNPFAILVEYRDGSRGACLNLPEQVSDMTFAAKIKGRAEPLSTHFVLPAPPGARFFDPLTFNIEKFFNTGKSPYPVERTYLTTVALDFAMRSRAEGGKRMENPALHVEYVPPESSGYFRGAFTDAG